MKTSVQLLVIGGLSLLMSACSEQAKPEKTTAENATTEAATEAAEAGSASNSEQPGRPAQSMQSEWAGRAKQVQNGTGSADVLGRAKMLGKDVWVMRVGTLSSWAGENQDTFATRAARYMGTMSRMTPYTYCGHLCAAPGTKDGPFSIDILTSKDAGVCAAVPVCSMPNGSGLKHYGQPTGNIVLINTNEAKIAPMAGENGHGYDAMSFTLADAEGKPLTLPAMDAKALGYYTLRDRTILQHQAYNKPARTVYDFNSERAQPSGNASDNPR